MAWEWSQRGEGDCLCKAEGNLCEIYKVVKKKRQDPGEERGVLNDEGNVGKVLEWVIMRVDLLHHKPVLNLSYAKLQILQALGADRNDVVMVLVVDHKLA